MLLKSSKLYTFARQFNTKLDKICFKLISVSIVLSICNIEPSVSELNVSDIVRHIIMLSDGTDEADAEARKLLLGIKWSEVQMAEQVVRLQVVPISYVRATVHQFTCQAANTFSDFFYSTTVAEVEHKALCNEPMQMLPITLGTLSPRDGPFLFC